MPFSRELWIERDDFMEDPPKKFFRLAPGREVRLRYAYLITCQDVVKDDAGDIVELRCTYDPATRGGDAPDGRKVQGTIHWVSAAARARLRRFACTTRLFTVPNPDDVEEGEDFVSVAESGVARRREGREGRAERGEGSDGHAVSVRADGLLRVGRCRFEAGARSVFNRTVTLRDTWAKIKGK